MSTLYTINIVNNSGDFKQFFVFQKPAIYTGGQKIYSNSVWSCGISPGVGSSATFLMLQQYYAGLQQQIKPPNVGEASGYSSAIQPINLTPKPPDTTTKNTTSMILPSESSGLGLTPTINTPEVQTGAFRIITPTFEPAVTPYNVGLASQTPMGNVILSNFIVAQPNQDIDCQPIVQFYVQTGTYQPGTVINFTSSSKNAAVCDATTGFVTFLVVYNSNGTWAVTESGPTRLMGQPRISASAQTHDSAVFSSNAPALKAEIKNEAGRAVICTGFAANFNAPVTVQNLSNPGVIHLNSEYQVGPTDGPYVGRMCINIAGNEATFQ
ncbi:hypothetical protein [Nostoc sphaeroides]|uniref:Uncharacterized protein n=1 Tax=Nostoc sphaeroides CCNUC1 TaxID=2653204 RepID=A0A5P8WHY4_9NOSO|nr:hypothetical protein [Nostoc sphaeroides]QFS51766.1 hypothetical protein GXM_09260 [Nostoc sphaeroides CCNUC1]